MPKCENKNAFVNARSAISQALALFLSLVITRRLRTVLLTHSRASTHSSSSSRFLMTSPRPQVQSGDIPSTPLFCLPLPALLLLAPYSPDGFPCRWISPLAWDIFVHDTPSSARRSTLRLISATMRLAVALSIAPEKHISTALRLSASQSLAFRLSVFGNPFSHSVSATP